VHNQSTVATLIDGCVHVHTAVTPDTSEIMSSIRSAPLPTFSGHALKLLLDKRPEDDWVLIVSQAADYYFAKFNVYEVTVSAHPPHQGIIEAKELNIARLNSFG